MSTLSQSSPSAPAILFVSLLPRAQICVTILTWASHWALAAVSRTLPHIHKESYSEYALNILCTWATWSTRSTSCQIRLYPQDGFCIACLRLYCMAFTKQPSINTVANMFAYAQSLSPGHSTADPYTLLFTLITVNHAAKTQCLHLLPSAKPHTTRDSRLFFAM